MLCFDQIDNWPRTMIFAHRGAGHSGPKPTTYENTIDAFREAIDIGANGIELDVRRTGDGELIVHHNERIKRFKRLLSEMTCDEVREAGKKRGYDIPTLQDTLQVCADRIALDIELKETGYEDEIVRLTRQYYNLRHVCFTSFADSSVKRIKEIGSGAIAGLLLGIELPASTDTGIRDLFPIRRVRRCGADFVVAHQYLLRLGYIRRVRKAGFPIIAWTVNNKYHGLKLMNRGIAVIITDRPDRFTSTV